MTERKATAKKVTLKLSYKAAHVKAQTARNVAKQARRLQVKPRVNLTRPSGYKNNLNYWQGLTHEKALKLYADKPVYISQYETIGFVPNELVTVSGIIQHDKTRVNYDLLGIKKHVKKAVKIGSTAAKGSGAYVGKAYGVNYPKAGGVVYDLWQFFDNELAKGNEVNGKLVKAHCVNNNLNTTTGSCQLFAWRKYQARLNA
jgi:hypothetical protein